MQRPQLGGSPLLFCGEPVCGNSEFATELTLGAHTRSGHNVLVENLIVARRVIQEAFSEIEDQCREEKRQYERSGSQPPAQKTCRWALYLSRERAGDCMASLMDFVKGNPECRSRLLPRAQIRFLVMLQHLVAEDTADFHRPEGERRHCDAFEGQLTGDGVNSQLVKDAHRSEWSVEGQSFLMKQANPGEAGSQDRKKLIVAFQNELVTALEEYLLAFCQRRELSAQCTQQLIRAVTTQMSQCGLANLDRSSQAARYFVSGQGLDQRTAYNISTMDAGSLGEALKLSMFCMKTGFRQFHTEESISAAASDPEMETGPTLCSPSSYLYQYATLRFVPRLSNGRTSWIECLVIDALDEVHIVPPVTEGFGPL